MKEVLESMKKEILSIAEYNAKLDSSSEEYARSNESYCRLCEEYNKLSRTIMDDTLNNSTRTEEVQIKLDELSLKKQELKLEEKRIEVEKSNNKWRNAIGVVTTIVSIGALGASIWACKKGWDLELGDNPEIITNTPGKTAYKSLTGLCQKIF